MLLCYNLENRSPMFMLAFAIACGLGSAYGFLAASKLIAAVGIIGGISALRKFWHEIKTWNGILLRADYLVLAWIVRSIGLLAVVAGFLVGRFENLDGTYIPGVGHELKLPIALALIITVLVVKPAGLFGRPIVKRV